MFNPEKAANIVAYFILKSGENSMRHLKIMKLLYLAEREYLNEYDSLMLDDDYFSMKNGPMLSKTYDLMKRTPCQEWDNLLSRINDNHISLKGTSTQSKLIYLSKANIKILDRVFELYGNKTAEELIEFTHDNCPEWQETNSRISIDIVDVLKALGKPSEIAESINDSKRI